MSDRRRPEQYGPARHGSHPTEPLNSPYPQYPDPAYADQLPTYGTGYVPPFASNPSTQFPQQYWQQGQPPPGTPKPGPPKPPRWLWLLAGAAVLLVVGLIAALVIANGSAKQQIAVPPLPTLRNPTSPTGPAPTPTTTPAPRTTAPPTTTTSPAPAAPPTETTESGTAATVVYNVSGEGRALSIAYVDTGGVLETEFNVALPWSKQVSLASSRSASVTVINAGPQVTCTVTVNGAQLRQHTGSILTICAAAGF